MKFLRMHVSKLDITSTSSSMTEFDKVALEEDINSRMSSELEKHLQFPDQASLMLNCIFLNLVIL
uniref:Uncharacterized protein n=1 Tax=Aegilops tauschii subsp. strangulata TaxID=200361 RepID=A0A452YFV9_AEGTS